METQKLDCHSIARYSRQLVLPEIGVEGQLKLQSSSVLIVGAGGLGCPAALYLAAAGVGKIGIVDYDEVELSNLHRQILHTEDRLGKAKCDSAAQACTKLNSKVDCQTYKLQLTSQNATSIMKEYDMVLDATDNVATRYLLNDASVLCGKPLVSGSALRWEGQLTLYNHDGGPCYRCLYPEPPPPETVTNCSTGGVLGVVPGIIGCLQALEAIKLITGLTPSYSQKMLLFDGLDCSFRTIKLRPKNSDCAVCGSNPEVRSLIDYELFCGSSATDKIKCLALLPDESRMTCKEYDAMLKSQTNHLLLDVRPAVEQSICSLPSSFNIQMGELESEETKKRILDLCQTADYSNPVPVVVVCHRGNDSQIAVKQLSESLGKSDLKFSIQDIIGGLEEWANSVDPEFPKY